MVETFYMLSLIIYACGAVWIGVVTYINIRDRYRDATQDKRNNNYQMGYDITNLNTDMRVLKNRVSALERKVNVEKERKK